MSTLEIRLLGTPQSWLGGELVTELRSDKVRALLAYLVVESDQPHRREKLAGLLWPGYPETSARASLRRALADLRSAIDDAHASPPYFDINRQAIQFNQGSDAWVDVIAFSKLARAPQGISEQTITSWEEAVEIYRGEFMDGFSIPDSPGFEEWLLQSREGLKRQLLDTLGRLVKGLEQRGDYQRGLVHAWRGVELDPLQENNQRGLMRLLALSGQREAALAQYEACVRTLAEELGVAPSVETRDLYDLIMAGESPLVSSANVEQRTQVPRAISACPYQGLAAFREQDAAFFFGREGFTEQLLESTRTHKVITVVIGPSGSGKSSVVYAGLLPKLCEQGDWLVANFRPGASPFHSLAFSLLPLLEPELSEADCLIQSHKLAAALGDGSFELQQLIERVLAVNQPGKKLLLMIDQFEELYTLCQQPAVQNDFLASLLAAVVTYLRQRSQFVYVILTMRADFMGQALSYRPFADMLQSSVLLLGPMTRQELRAVIEMPAEAQGAAFEGGLVERILEDVGGEPGNLPLLEFALTLLWEKADSGWLTHTGYEYIGKVAGALAKYAEEVYAGLDQDDQEQSRRVFLQLVHPGEGTEDTRRVASRSEIGDENWSLVQYLADKRLVVTGRNGAGVETIEVVHEALISSWERLGNWIEAERAFRIWQEGLRNAIHQWEVSGGDEGALLRGSPLGKAESWLETHVEVLSTVELDFIQASKDLSQRDAAARELFHQRELQAAQQLARSERRRRDILLAFVAVLSFAFVVAVVLTVFSLRQQRAALEAYSVSLAANAQQAIDDGDSAAALALALAANEMDEPPLQAQRVLLTAAFSPGARYWYEIAQQFPGAVGPATALAVAPDNRTVFIGLEDGTLIIWDSASGKERNRIQGHSARVNDIAIDPAGDLAVSVSDDAQAIVWDIRTGMELHRFAGHSGLIRALDISQDGRFVVTGGFSSSGWEAPGELILWDLATGIELRRFVGHVAGVVTADFCLHDQAIVASSGDTELFSSIGSAENSSTVPTDMLLWNATDGELIHEFEGLMHEAFTIAVSPDGEQVLVGSYYDGVISRYDITTGERLAALQEHEDAVGIVVYGTGGLIALSGSEDGKLILWDLPSSTAIAELSVHTGEVLDIDLMPDGRRAISSAQDGSMIFWDLVDAAEINRFYGHGDMVWDVALVPGKRQIVSSSGTSSVNLPTRDTSLRLWDLSTAKQIKTIPLNLAVVMQVAVSPDGQTVMYSGADPFVHLLDLPSWSDNRSLAGHQSIVPCIEFLPDGKKVLSCSSDGTLILWDLEVGTPLYHLDGRPRQEGVWAVAISPDGSTALSDTGDGTMILWDMQTGEEIRTFRSTDPLTASGASGIAYLPDGSTALSAAKDGNIIEWDLETGEEIRLIGNHASLRTRIVITPDGKLALSAGMDGRLMLWDLESGQLVRSSAGHGIIFDVTLSDDGRTVFFGSSDTTIVEWQLSNPTITELKDWIEANRYVRPLSCPEREFYQVEPLCEPK